MSENSKSETILGKILVGVAIAVIPALILFWIGIDDKKESITLPSNSKLDSSSISSISTKQSISESDTANSINAPKEDRKTSNSKSNFTIVEIDYREYMGLYTGTTNNTATSSKGSTILELIYIDQITKKVKVQVKWYNGLYGEGRLSGAVNNKRIEVQGSLSSEITGNWDIEMTIDLIDNKSLTGTYRIYPLAGNPNGTQYGNFELKKEH